jgi:hypothetical protein
MKEKGGHKGKSSTVMAGADEHISYSNDGSNHYLQTL